MTPTSWSAATWEDIAAAWEGLRPGIPGVPRLGADALTAPQAGVLFQRWVLEAFRLSGAAGHYPFTVEMESSRRAREEIDGLIIDGWQGFLLESKRESRPVGFAPIAKLQYQVEQRFSSTLGLFFSTSGYTLPALETAELMKPNRVLLFYASDLDWAVQRPNCMMEMLRRKWLLALKTGRSYLSVDQSIEFFEGAI